MAPGWVFSSVMPSSIIDGDHRIHRPPFQYAHLGSALSLSDFNRLLRRVKQADTKPESPKPKTRAVVCDIGS